MTPSDGWAPVKLGELLTLRREAVPVEADRLYPNLGLYSFGRGVFEKSPINGSQTSAPALYRVRSGQLIYSRLFAFEGAFAIVPNAMDGWFVSNEYPAFDVDAERAVAEFLNLSICQPAVWKDLAARTVGMGHRRQRLHPDALLEYEIEIPPIDDQQCIARSVRAATEVGDAARGEAAAARDLAEAVYASLAAARKLEPTELRHVMKLDLHRVDVETEAQYRPAGVKIAGGGLFWRDPLRGDETTYKSLHRLMAHQVVYRKLTAWEGPITVVPPAFEGAVVSPEFPTFTLDRARLEPDFMAFICRRPAFHAEMKARGTGTAERRNRLKPQDFLEITVGLPDLEGQRRIAAIERAAVALVAEAEAADRTALAIRDRVFSTRTLTGARR